MYYYISSKYSISSCLISEIMKYLFYYMTPTRKIKTNRTHQISVKTKVYFVKTEL